jgi:putative OPT family oligopeptide transporter
MTGDQPAATDAGRPSHTPYVLPETVLPEFTWSAVIVGAILGIIFGASSLYLVLKVGMTVSASIPIAVLSITLFRLFTPLLGRNATILENNIVQTTGSAGESIAFGVGVTMPALLILGYNLEYVRVALVAVLGGLLGILMMIPLRRAFIVQQHGKLAYPEGTACADVLIVGEKGGTSALTVFVGFFVAFAYYFLNVGLKLWKDIPEWPLWKQVGAKVVGFKGAIVSCEIAPHLMAVGYIIGTRISCIMVGGGVLAAWVLTPAIVFFGSGLTEPLYPGDKLISAMSPGEIRGNYVLYIGAGAVAAGGIISMLQAMPLILASVRSGLRDIARGANMLAGGTVSRVPRTERDLSMKVVLLGSLGLVLAIWAAPMLKMNLVGALCIVVFGFLFVTVSSRLTGEIGSSSNPISGMTVATLLMTCLIFLVLGWTTPDHKLTALSIAGIVCIAASNGGTTSQDLKTGFLVGGTPRNMQLAILVGALTSALVIGVTLLVLNDGGTVYSRKDLPAATLPLRGDEPHERVRGPYAKEDAALFSAVYVRAGELPGVHPGKYLVDQTGRIHYLVDPGVNGKLNKQDDGTPVTKYDAPKARLMADLIEGILSQQMPWSLVLLGVCIALVLELAGIPSLPFAVGVYLPLSSSTPIFVGGMVRWIVDKGFRRGQPESEMSPGVLLSSGLIAGGTIAGILAALIQAKSEWAKACNLGPAWLGALADADGFALLPFGLLTAFLILVGAEKLLRAAPANR